MSARARSLLKRLREKKQEEEGPGEIEEDNKKDYQLAPIKTQSKNSHSVPKDMKNKKEEVLIDPLDYFKTQHIFIKESTMEEYGDEQIKKEVEEEKKRERELEGQKQIGGMIGRGFNVNFEELMNVRAKVTREQEKRALSVGTRNLKSQNIDKTQFEYIKKDTDSKEDNLLIKLILAKNKFSSGSNQNLYLEILKRIDELKEYTLPDIATKKLNDIIKDLKLPKNLILCQDVQVVSDDEDDTDPIGKKISLDQVINKMNIKSDM
jgi:hypothetical protein